MKPFKPITLIKPVAKPAIATTLLMKPNPPINRMKLTQSGEFALASEVDKVVEELAKRIGLKLADIAALADELDGLGEVDAASAIDKLLLKKDR